MTAHWKDLITRHIGGRDWILTFDAAAAAKGAIESLQEHGADDFFLIAGSEGTGDRPDLPPEQMVLLNTSGSTIMEGIRAFYAALRNLPSEVVAKIDAWDPGRRALVFGSWLDADAAIAGRHQFGGRPSPWALLEDKITVSDLWDRAGIPRPDYRIVPVTEAAVGQAMGVLNQGTGVVITADNKAGWHGGGEMSRVISGTEGITAAVSDLAPYADVVRVTPYLTGTPCSIHGVIFPDYVLTVRPVEMVTMVQGNKFRYSGTASYWRPETAAVESMRELAVQLGAHLRESLGYRGTFTMDGVLTGDRFLPTELNPRYGAGFATLTGDAEVRSTLVHQLLVAGVEAEWRPGELERLYRTSSEGKGAGGGFSLVDRAYEVTESLDIRWNGDGWTPVGEEDDGDGTLTRGPAITGGLVRVSLTPERTPFGQSVTNRVIAGFRLADELWDAGIGPLIAASEYRV
jgi:hypothetical protein